MLGNNPILIGVFLLLIVLMVVWSIFAPDEEEISLMGTKGGKAKKDPLAQGYSFEDKLK